MNGSRVAVIGSGGREHAICWKLSQSPLVSQIFVIPGNGGTKDVEKLINVSVDTKDFKEIVSLCYQHKIDLVVVGPEVPLADGITNFLNRNGITCFGPTAEAARIESDKKWSKVFMNKYEIPTARWKSFVNAGNAKDFIKNAPYPATVIKASGLAAGKGVVVADSKDGACKAVDEIMTTEAGHTLVVEEFLEGEEVSVLAFTDGKTIKAMLPVQDHKRLLNKDLGPNTGGMGSFCPYPLSVCDMNYVREHVLQKAIDGLAKENCPFVGVLYAGLMITTQDIKVLEFNCRFGDPETQVLMPLLETDLFQIFKACCDGTLDQCHITWKQNLACVCVVMASEGYPERVTPGRPISGLQNVEGVPELYVFHAATAIQNDSLVTSGGRVLNVVAVDGTLQGASTAATNMCLKISFNGCQYRTDIAHKGIVREILLHGSGSYQSAGVDISSGNELIKKIKPIVESTFQENVLSSLGSFGAVVDARLQEYSQPLLVSGCDGVGTKLKIAQLCNNHRTIGQDLVAMCVNDILAHGAKPLFFLDYFASGKLKTGTAEEVIKGIAEGCKLADCALVGGETAEMPGFYSDDEYDLAGFAVGVVDKSKLLPTENICEGDTVIYLPSSGIHSNGFSLVRKIMEDCNLSYTDTADFSREGKTYGDEFLKPTEIYVRRILPLIMSSKIKGFAHITGGGLLENANRIIPANLKVHLDAMKWHIHPVFAWIAIKGSISEHEMLRTFNCGVGAVVVVSPQFRDEICEILRSNVIGCVKNRNPGEAQVNVVNFSCQLGKSMLPYVPRYLGWNQPPKSRVAVLISGAGTNLQCLIDSTFEKKSTVQIVLVISSNEKAAGLKIAEKYQIPALILKRKGTSAAESDDRSIHEALLERKVEIVCLAGYMHILSEWFVKQWRGKMLNVHPSLLPSFKGLHAQRQALAAGVRISGCTVHFVEPEVDAGAIIEQAMVPVYHGDTEYMLTERIKEKEHVIFPQALELVASKRVILNLQTGRIIWTL